MIKKFNRKKILFICTQNSARSQMAEGLVNYFFNKEFEAFSAGTNPSKVNPYAIKVMKEIGINISNHRSKHVSEFYGTEFDLVVTVCDNAKKVCPFFPGAKKLVHNSFKDPVEVVGSDESILATFRGVRDDIFKWLSDYFFKANP